MKITLVYPGIAQIGFGSFGRGTPTTNLMSLGLGYLGASIKKNTKHEVDVLDLRKMKGWDDFGRELKERSCDIAGIYTNTVNFEYAMKCAEITHKMGKTVIAGGPHATLAPQELLDTGHVDHVITGEAEFTIVDVLEKFDRGLGMEKIIQGQPVENLDELPFPDRDLFNLDKRLKYLPGIFPFPPRYAGVLASRGCGFNCKFCQPLERKIFGKRLKFRSVDNIIKEVAQLKERYGVEFIMFQDDQLTQNREWVLDLSAEMKKVGIDWGALARVDTINEHVVKSMKEAGCLVLQFGFESGSQKILDFLRKRAGVEQAVEAARLCHENGVLIFANYMMGIPTETEEDVEATYELMKKINPEIHALSYFSPIPGSDLYDYCKERDLINVTSYDMYARGAVENKLKGIDYKALDRMKKKIEKCTPAWYQESYYASCVMKRWRKLAKQGHTVHMIKELVTHTPMLDSTVGAVYRMVKR
ncbi:MAG: radical SAM protein [Nitrospirae bacterium]|nr:radical SAM protein [Nitrospirota bacterium]